MAEERFTRPVDIPDFVKDVDEMMAKGESMDTPAEVTIKFGKGLVGDTFTSKSGKELVEVSIPNADRSDTRPWETFVISPKMIHDNKFGKGVWMKLPETDTVRLSRSVKSGVDETGKTIWKHETREVTSAELKALMESYKEKNKGKGAEKNKESVLSGLSERKAEKETEKPPGKAATKKQKAR